MADFPGEGDQAVRRLGARTLAPLDVPTPRQRGGSDMTLEPILLGDGRLRAQGWLVISGGAVRAILTPGDQAVYHSFACDRRVYPPDGFMTFSGLSEAGAWMSMRLEPEAALPQEA